MREALRGNLIRRRRLQPPQITIRNRQQTRPIDRRYLRSVVDLLLGEETSHGVELGVLLVGDPEMTKLNEGFARHRGTTDVLAFDYADPGANLRGEIVICVDVAVAQARRFHTTWQSEVVRYLIHGFLHLLGYEDSTPARRRVMKRHEGRMLQLVARRFTLAAVEAS